MSGAPLLHALFLFVSVLIIVIAAQRWNVHPLFALAFTASAFALACGFSIGFLGKTFAVGFSQTIYAAGLVIVAAELIAGWAEDTAGLDRLAALVAGCQRLVSGKAAALLGLLAGIGASPVAAYALLTPLLRAAGDSPAYRRETTTLALSLSASHGLMFLSPVPIAAAAILNAEWHRVALFGVPLAVLIAALGALLSRSLPLSPTALASIERPLGQKEANGSAIILLAAVVIPLLMLMIASIGDMPTEPLGGGAARERLLGLGRPLILFLAGTGIMLIGHWRLSPKLLADQGRAERVLGSVARLLMIVGAAGGLQTLCQETRMAELLGERLLAWHGGLLVPFAIAALIKSLQGSSLVAAITTAGMAQPILGPLGLAGTDGRALAALAVGAGAMSLSHVNDPYFWLIADRTGLSPLRALATFTLATLLQGAAAVAVLLAIAAFISG